MHSRTKVQLLVVPLFALIVVPIILFNEPVARPQRRCPALPPTVEPNLSITPALNTTPDDLNVTPAPTYETFPLPSINESAVGDLDTEPLLVRTKIRWIFPNDTAPASVKDGAPDDQGV